MKKDPPKTKHVKFIEIDPDDYFSEWAYPPNNAQWAALGVTKRERLDAERTRRARAHARGSGVVANEVAKIRITRHLWTASNPPKYDFREGDLFWAPKNIWIQVARDDEPLEVHSNQSGQMTPYQITPAELAGWLQTGIVPIHNKITPYQCHGEIDKYLMAAAERDNENRQK